MGEWPAMPPRLRLNRTRRALERRLVGAVLGTSAWVIERRIVAARRAATRTNVSSSHFGHRRRRLRVDATMPF